MSGSITSGSVVKNQALTSVLPIGGQVGITFEDEGVPLGTNGTVDTVNIVGDSLSAARVGNTVTITGAPTTPTGPAGGALAGTYPDPSLNCTVGIAVWNGTILQGRTLTSGGEILFLNPDGTGGNPNLSLASTTVAAGSYGDATHIPSFTVDAKGRLTAASSNAITTTGGQAWTYTVKSANFNASAANHYEVNANGVTATLPGSPTAGDRIRFTILANVTTFTLGRNGNKIMADANDVSVPTYTFPYTLELVYANTDGWSMIGA